MIFRENGTRVDLTDVNSTDPIARDFHEKSKEIREMYRFPIRMKTRWRRKYNVTGAQEPPQSAILLTKGKFKFTNGVSETIRYSRTEPTRTSNGKMSYVEGLGIMVTDSLTIHEGDMDLAYFALYYSPSIAKKILTVENKAKEATEALRARGSMAMVEYYLTDESGPLYDDSEKLRRVAMAFGVAHSDSENVSDDEVKLALLRTVEIAEASKDPFRNIEAFKAATKSDVNVRKMAMIQKGLDSERLVYDVMSLAWKLDVGGDIVTILRINSQDVPRKEQILIRHLDTNQDHCGLFERVVGKPGEWLGNFEQAQELKGDALLDKCREYGINTFGRKHDHLRNELKEKMKG